MLKKAVTTTLIGAALAMFALGVTACDNLPTALTQNLPISLAPATSTPIPTDTPSPAPQAAATPNAPQGKAPQRAQAAAGLQALLKASGLQGGVVTANNGDSLALKLGKTTQSFRVASNAIVVVPDKSNAIVSDIQVGDRVIAHVAGSDANAAAAFLLDIPAGYTANNVMLAAVQSNNRGTLTLRARGGARDVTTTESTMVVNIGGDPPALASLSDLRQGVPVLVIGDGSNGSFESQVIVILDKSVRDLQRRINKNRPLPTPTPGA